MSNRTLIAEKAGNVPSLMHMVLSTYFQTSQGNDYLRGIFPSLDDCEQINEDCSTCRSCGAQDGCLDSSILDDVLHALTNNAQRGVKRRRLT